MESSLVYISLGGNIGPSKKILQSALQQINESLDFFDGRVSRFYRTTAVSLQPQKDYINAVCSFRTSCSPLEVLSQLQKIETNLGKVPKSKEDPRPIDLDILFFGDLALEYPQLKIPHPSWKERLFVLVPLLDLVDSICEVKLKETIAFLSKNTSQEIELWNESQ